MDKTIYQARYKLLLLHLRQSREDRGVFQKDFAKALKTNQASVSKIESGQLRIDTSQLEVLCKTMNMSLSEFILSFESKHGLIKKKK